MKPKDELNKIKNYLEETERCSQLLMEGNAFINTVDVIKEEIDSLENQLENVNHKLKPFDFVDFFYDKNIATRDLKIINKLLQDLKLHKQHLYAHRDYMNKWEVVYNRAVYLGRQIVCETIENQIEAFYNSNDLITFVVLLDGKEEIMTKVLERRRVQVDTKIKYFDGDKEVFYKLLVSQELCMWDMLFPGDLSSIFTRLVLFESPLGVSQFERFLFSIFSFYFKGQSEETLRLKLGELVEGVKNLKGELREIKEVQYSKMPVGYQDFCYNAFHFKSLREFLKDGVVEL